MLDAAGRLRSVINPLGQKTVYTPDALDRITHLTDAINGVTQFGYDANSNLLTVTDAKGQQAVYTPNNMNRTESRKDPLLNNELYTYDNNGNLKTVTDRKGQITTYTYDPLNRRTKTLFHDNTSTNYTYDAGNRLRIIEEKSASNVVTATITRDYFDVDDQLKQEITPQGQVDYTYDAAGRRATMTVAGQTQIVYTFDNANRLTNIQQGTSNIVIGYDDADRRTSVTYPNTNSVMYGYNNASELTSVTYKKGATTLGDLTYTYDLAGNRIKTGGTFARSNIPPALTTTTYNANNQQKVFGTTTENYDLNGNLIDTADAGVVTTYTWNVRNQLTNISRTGLTASFSYDSFGRRTGRTVNETVTNFVYDGLNPVQEKNGATVTANLLTGLGIDEFFTRTEGGTARSLLPDALGSTVALGDGTGTLQTQYTYEPFGFTSQTGTASTNSYKFTGREDDGTGLFYYRARYYQPRLQRFIAEDPIGFYSGETNFYSYAYNNVLMFSDPTGLFGMGDLPLVPPSVANFSAGFGSALSFGLTDFVLNMTSGSGVINRCSTSYSVGTSAGTAWGIAMAGMGIASGGFRPEFGNWKQGGKWFFPQGWRGPHFHWGSGPGLQTHHLPWQANSWLSNFSSLVSNGRGWQDIQNMLMVFAGAGVASSGASQTCGCDR